jgi:hypothetical protein
MLTILFVLCCYSPIALAQNAPERSAPYTALRWEGEQPYANIKGEWYLLLSIEGIDLTDVVSFSKEKYKKRWQKRISEDLVEVLSAMGHTLPTPVKLSVKKGTKTLQLTEAMTTKNRSEARKYNKEHPIAEAKDAKLKSDDLQTGIAKAVNLTMEKPFQVKSAKVEYRIEGHSLFAGKETIYFDDYGKTVVVVTDKPGIMNNPEKTTTIWKDNKTTVLNHLKKTYFTTPIRPKSTEPPVISYSNATQRKQGGYEAQASQKICGKECEVFKHKKMNVTYCLGKDFLLRRSTIRSVKLWATQKRQTPSKK